MIHIHKKEVNKTSEYNLIHDIINNPKHAKNLNSHYYPIIHVCMNNRRGEAKFKNFQILLDSGFRYTILMGRIAVIICLEKYAVTQWHTQAGNITNNIKVKVDFALIELSATET